FRQVIHIVGGFLGKPDTDAKRLPDLDAMPFVIGLATTGLAFGTRNAKQYLAVISPRLGFADLGSGRRFGRRRLRGNPFRERRGSREPGPQQRQRKDDPNAFRHERKCSRVKAWGESSNTQ